MLKISRKAAITTIGASAALLALGGVSGAVAAGQIGSGGIKNESLTTVDIKNGSLRVADLRPEAVAGLMGQKGATGAPGPKGDIGNTGAKGDKGDSGLLGAYYSVAFYDVGDTNAGAIATVACSAQTDVAISGGVQVLGIDAGANARNTPVSSSFPGRMDFAAGTPLANRLDGWIVQFGGDNAKPPMKTKIWALCVPGATIPVNETYVQSN
jgi:hypothetical protein